MYSKISTRLQAELSKVFDAPVAGAYVPRCVIHNPNTGFKFSPRYVTALDIEQNFVSSYMDATQVVIRITPGEYQDIIDNSLDLECTITLTPVDVESGKEILTIRPIKITGAVVLKNQEDISKLINANNIPNEDAVTDTDSAARNQFTFEYTFHLIDKNSYNLRHTQINSILTNVTVEQVIHWVAQQLSIETVKVVPPDNTQVYDNFVIPVSDISTIFTFIQERYGIYSKGLGYYYSSNTLYVYPQYDTDFNNSTETGIVRLISAPEQSYLGMDHYHLYNDDDLWIVTNSNKAMMTLNSVGEENSGNVHVSANTDNQRDSSVVINKDGSVVRSANTLSVVQMSNKQGSMSSKSQNFKYVGQRSNIYQSTSEMAANNGSLLACAWAQAVPRSIVPGKVISYQYDDTDMKFSAQNGRVLSVSYTSNKQPQLNNGVFWLTFTAKVSAFIDPEKSDDSIVHYN